MVNLGVLIKNLMEEGYSRENAEARVCQDVVLMAISNSNLKRNVTIKGGVVMRNISNDIRRTTQDMDFDFIRYPLEKTAILNFIKKLNCVEGVTIRTAGPIEELSQQEYRGKRVYVTFEDETETVLASKIDLGVHKQMQIEQEEYCFDVCMDDEGVSLLMNSKEQIFTEKLRSLLNFGPVSTRYKDIYDLCFLSENLDYSKTMDCLKAYILDNPEMRENDLQGIQTRVSRTFSNKNYRNRIEKASSANWLQINIEEAFGQIESFLSELRRFGRA